LADQHPDCVKVTMKFGRYHHQVDYKPFRYNTLKRVDNYDKMVNKGINNYTMTIKKVR